MQPWAPPNWRWARWGGLGANDGEPEGGSLSGERPHDAGFTVGALVV
jgi:hypothetical protein